MKISYFVNNTDIFRKPDKFLISCLFVFSFRIKILVNELSETKTSWSSHFHTLDLSVVLLISFLSHSSPIRKSLRKRNYILWSLVKAFINLSNYFSSDIYLLKEKIEFTADNNDRQVLQVNIFLRRSKLFWSI